MSVTAEKPAPVKADLANIPAELKALRRWVAWEWVWKNNKWDKPPRRPKDRGARDWELPKHWASVERALACRMDGIGFAFGSREEGEDDPLNVVEGEGVVALDLDACGNRSTGEIDPAALEVVRDFDSYAEWSPSGTGLRIFITAPGFALPGKGKAALGAPWEGRGGKAAKVEVFVSTGYVTVTGAHLGDTPATVEERTEKLRALLARLEELKQREKAAKAAPKARAASGGRLRNPAPAEAGTPATWSDDDVIDRARRSGDGRTEAAWGVATTRTTDRSEADATLAQAFWYWSGGDRARVDRLFRRAELFRPKWDEVHNGEGATYGAMTLDLACRGKHWEPKEQQAELSAPDGPHDTDKGNGSRLVRLHGKYVRHAHAWKKWLVWDGKRWRMDEVGDITERAKSVTVQMFAEATEGMKVIQRELEGMHK